jgi:O-antigen/teichoic acid export membrane protein
MKGDLAVGEVSPHSDQRDRLLAHNAVVVVGTMAAGLLGGVLFLGVISHRLHPTEYGAVFTIVTLLNLIGLPANALTLLMSRETSRDRASGRHAASTALLGEGNRALLLLGTIMGALLALASPALSKFLDVPTELLLAAAAGIPFILALPLLLGELQGNQRFLGFSSVVAGYAALKLVAAILLGTVLGAFGVVAGISVAGALSYLIAVRMLRRKLAMKPRWPWLRPALSYLAVVLPGTLAIAVLLSVDVVMVKHFFSARQAGEYAAVAALGRAIFWGASGVAAVLFPKIVFQETQRRKASHMVLSSLILVVGGGLFGLALLSVAAGHVLAVFAGAAYSSGSAYLAWYALGMTLLGAAVVLIATHQSRGQAAFLAVVIPISAIEPVLIASFHSSLIQVVQVLDACMAVLVGGLAALALAESRVTSVALEHVRNAEAPSLTLSPVVPPLGVQAS